jgi:hypothetical protein
MEGDKPEFNRTKKIIVPKTFSPGNMPSEFIAVNFRFKLNQ